MSDECWCCPRCGDDLSEDEGEFVDGQSCTGCGCSDLTKDQLIHPDADYAWVI